jgi:lysophospholipid acyltransferase (LPLAT)-like uncharacterized protein
MPRWFVGLVALLLCAVLRLLRWTWRVRIVGAAPDGRCLYVFWHGDQVALSALRPRQLAGQRLAVLVSQSRDGQLGAFVARWLGLDVVRGSSSRGGARGALALVRRLRAAGTVAIAVDGPRGPRHRCGESAQRIAAQGGAVTVPVAAAARRRWVLGSWDRLWIPGPFAVVHVVIGGPAASAQSGLEAASRAAHDQAVPAATVCDAA